MGFGNHGEGYKYVSVANGKLNTKVGAEKKEFDYFEGTLLSIGTIEDTYEEKPIQKVELIMSNGDNEKIKLKFTLEAWFSVGFFSRIGKIDLTKQFRIGAFPSEKNEKISFCYMRQGDKKIEAEKSAPRPVKKQMGKKTVDDWTEFDKFADSCIAKLSKKLNGTVAAQTGDDSIPAPTDDDLPF